MHAQAEIWTELGRHLLQRDNDKEVRKDFPVRYHSLSESCKRRIGPTSRYCHHLLSRQCRQPPSPCATLSDPAGPQLIHIDSEHLAIMAVVPCSYLLGPGTPLGLHQDSTMGNPYPPRDSMWTGGGLEVDLGSISWLTL